MKVDMNVVRVLVNAQYRLIACTDNLMLFEKDKEVASLGEETICFSTEKSLVELSLDRLSWNGNQTCVYDVAQRWGWELGVGKIRNNYIA